MNVFSNVNPERAKFLRFHHGNAVVYPMLLNIIVFSTAAELAAKKTRVKQSLIKRARSVAIFSLKLKERRAREAEKQAINLAEQEKV